MGFFSFESILYVHFFNVLIVMPDIEPKKVFISYSWKYKQKVRDIVDELLAKGIDVIFDLYDLKPGDDLHYFMERSVNDPSIDYVLIFSDHTYANKADERESGVGTETLIIAQEVYSSKDDSKFIPIVLEKDEDGLACLPHYLKGRYYIDLSSDEKYEEQFDELIHHIYNVPSNRKPALGKPPANLSDSKYDLSLVKDCIRNAKSSINPMLIPDMINSTIDAYQRIFADTEHNLDSFYESLKQSLDIRDLIIGFITELIKHNEKPEDFIVQLMESIGDLRVQFPSQIHNDLVSFIQWELFLSIVSVYIYINNYEGLNGLLHRTYYMYDWYDKHSKNSYNYQHILAECHSLNSYYESQKLGNKFSTMADALMNRTNTPILTKTRLISADMLLYHLYPFVATDNGYWFPLTYVYQTRDVELYLPWSKLESKDQFNHVAPLLGGISLDEFKSKMEYPYSFSMSYNGTFNHALWITDYISPGRVGTRD